VRAPFPEEKYRKDDLAKIKDSGFNTVQLWMVWGWIKHPAHFSYLRLKNYPSVIIIIAIG
jgi:beta-galactosidase